MACILVYSRHLPLAQKPEPASSAFSGAFTIVNSITEMGGILGWYYATESHVPQMHS
jgi:hypothetical protein